MQTLVSPAVRRNGHSRTGPAAALVIGGGIGGMRAALDLADAGLKVYLVEQTPCLGGRVAQLGYMFPQHDCVLCRGTPDHGYGCTRPSISPAYIQQQPTSQYRSPDQHTRDRCRRTGWRFHCFPAPGTTLC